MCSEIITFTAMISRFRKGCYQLYVHTAVVHLHATPCLIYHHSTASYAEGMESGMERLFYIILIFGHLMPQSLCSESSARLST